MGPFGCGTSPGAASSPPSRRTTGTPHGVLTGHTGRVLSVSFHPAGELFATGSSDGTVRLWVSRPFRGPELGSGPEFDGGSA